MEIVELDEPVIEVHTVGTPAAAGTTVVTGRSFVSKMSAGFKCSNIRLANTEDVPRVDRLNELHLSANLSNGKFNQSFKVFLLSEGSMPFSLAAKITVIKLSSSYGFEVNNMITFSN